MQFLKPQLWQCNNCILKNYFYQTKCQACFNPNPNPQTTTSKPITPLNKNPSSLLKKLKKKATSLQEEHLKIVQIPNKKLPLIIAFSGMQGGFHSLNVYEFTNFFTKNYNEKCHFMFLKDKYKVWYFKGIQGIKNKSMNGLLDELYNHIIKLSKYITKIITIGTSAGGFASLLYGILLNKKLKDNNIGIYVNDIIAFGPQSFVDRKNRELFSEKFREKAVDMLYDYLERNKDLVDIKYFDLNNVRDLIDRKLRLSISMGKKSASDKIHVPRLKEWNNLLDNEMDFIEMDGGHWHVKDMRDSGKLQQIIDYHLNQNILP